MLNLLRNSINVLRKVSGLDSDASAFITAAGLTDPTQKSAINTLVKDMKAAGLWTKMKAVYPMVGGTATSMKFNLKDPRDLDAAFRLTWSGGWTYSATGATPNGTNAFADTKLNDSILTPNSSHLSFYSRTNINQAAYDIGLFNSTNGIWLGAGNINRIKAGIFQTGASVELDGGVADTYLWSTGETTQTITVTPTTGTTYTVTIRAVREIDGIVYRSDASSPMTVPMDITPICFHISTRILSLDPNTYRPKYIPISSLKSRRGLLS
jgi:hypothetical protein